MNRIYQGRVTRVERAERVGKGHAASWQELAEWPRQLWQHHELFQSAVNYYLVALNACASDPTGAAGLLRQQLRGSWEPFSRPAGTFVGLRESLLGFVDGLTENSTIDEAFGLIFARNESDEATRQLALDSLLHDLGGEAKVQQGGRQYFPYLCQPTTKARFPRDAAALEKASGQQQLPTLMHAQGAEAEWCAAPEKLPFTWFANAQPAAEPYSGAAAKAKLVEAAESLLSIVGAAELMPDFKTRIAELADEHVSFPAYTGGSINKQALKRRFFAWLIFRFVEASPRTFAWLRNSFPQPKTSRANKSVAKRDRASIEVRLTSRGDDPIKLARGARRYVFPAFTALPCWGAKYRGDVQWSEFDIAAFKEALKTLNQFRLKTEERVRERKRLEQFCAFIDGESDSFGPESADDEPPGRLPLADPRRALVTRLIDELQPENQEIEGEASHDVISRRARRGLRDLVEKWNRRVEPGEPFSPEKHAELKGIIASYQGERAESMGSATLFHKLIEQDFWTLWQMPAPAEIAQRQRDGASEDPLREFYDYCDAKAEVERLKMPIRFTPADAKHSRRLFMFSDLTGKSTARHVPGAYAVDVSIALKDGDCWRESRVRLTYSAPCFGRDHLQGTTDDPASVWLPPVLSAFLQNNTAPPQDFSACAVSLMPDSYARQSKTPDGAIHIREETRYLLNFPIALDVAQVTAHFRKAARWKGQFNAMDDVLIHLHWPTTMDSKKQDSAWWREGDKFYVLAIDLGQRFAVAAAIITAHRGEGHWEIGTTDGGVWRAKLLRQRDLRLQGEDARVLIDGEWKMETPGARGRLATNAETDEAKTLLRVLAPNETFADDAVARFVAESESRFFPAQNDTLLRAFRRAQGHLAKYQRWAAALRAGISLDEELADQDLKPEWKTAAATDALFQTLFAEIAQLQAELPRHLVTISNRVAPLRGRSWEWLTIGQTDDGRPLHRLDQTGANRGKVWLRATRTFDEAHRTTRRAAPSRAVAQSRAAAPRRRTSAFRFGAHW